MQRLTLTNSSWAGLLRVLALALAFAFSAAAQQAEPPNSVLLIAKPGLDDPNFSHSVVLVTQAPDFSTVGVILNRPTTVRYQGKPVWAGGPVMRQVVVALFRSEQAPATASFHVLKNVYLSMHPQNLEALLAAPAARFRLYSGFAAWAPGQLDGEFGRDAWHVLPADEALVFREDMSGLWEELVRRAAGPKT